MSWFSSLFGGSNPTLNQNIGNFQSIGGSASKTGLGDLDTVSNFETGLLSGNQAEIGKLLAPQIGSIQKQGQQQRNQLAQFGGRSGGTTSSSAQVTNDVHSSINDLISSLTSNAASGLASTGSTLLSSGLSAFNSADAASQQRLQNIMNSILGKSAADFTQTALNAGEGQLGL